MPNVGLHKNLFERSRRMMITNERSELKELQELSFYDGLAREVIIKLNNIKYLENMTFDQYMERGFEGLTK